MLRSTTTSTIRKFSSNARFVLPAFENEPFRHYAPGLPETLSLKAACEKIRSEVVEIPCVVNGKDIFTGDVTEQVIPSDHGHVIARMHNATPEVVQMAIDTSNSARKDWENMPFEHRAAIFKKAADLIAEPWASRVMATTMLGTGKTPWQAEIDSRVESVDFLRLNNKFAENIYTEQPPLNSRNTWNRLRYRGMEGFVLAVSPFNFCAIGANLVASPALMGNTVIWKPSSTAALSNYTILQIFKEAGLPDGVVSFLPSPGPTVGEAIKHKDFGGMCVCVCVWNFCSYVWLCNWVREMRSILVEALCITLSLVILCLFRVSILRHHHQVFISLEARVCSTSCGSRWATT
jgi:1-pyrroline-5-carboxylate dehydrogenase